MKVSELKAIIREVIEEGGGSRSRKQYRQSNSPNRAMNNRLGDNKINNRQVDRITTNVVGKAWNNGNIHGPLSDETKKQGKRAGGQPAATKRAIQNRMIKGIRTSTGNAQKDYDNIRKQGK